jgi:aminopeptidase
VYFVPESVHGVFPFKYAEETIGLLHVKDGMIYKSQFVYGDYEFIRNHNERLMDDPMIGAIGELGFGTQVLPFSGRDIQDEKVFGTVHIATGRDDHLGGNITPDLFKEHKNASHDDILYALYKTPEIRLPEVRMNKDSKTTVLIQNYIPSEFLVNLISS